MPVVQCLVDVNFANTLLRNETTEGRGLGLVVAKTRFLEVFSSAVSLQSPIALFACKID